MTMLLMSWARPLAAEENLPAGQSADTTSQKSSMPLSGDETEQRALQRFLEEDVYFDPGSGRLSPQAMQVLDRKAAWLNAHPNVQVIIEGHTDTRGSHEKNLAMGERRAGAVKSYLIQKGISADRLQAVSYGKEQPVDGRNTPAAHAKNRRCRFVLR